MAIAARIKALEALMSTEEVVQELEEPLKTVGEILLNIAWRFDNAGIENGWRRIFCCNPRFIIAYHIAR